ncbi:MAG: hypothetical protein PHI97_30590 [Desulfobulbus sp.]|jgi:hypothetical protein|nr:hypothetical protein [Desulfobulbus sp.]
MLSNLPPNLATGLTGHPLPHVLIHVEGGLVQAVYASAELDIQVYDLDVPSFATPLEIKQIRMIAAQFEQQRQGLLQLY